MPHAAKLLLAAASLLLSFNVSAACSMAAIMNAPKMPAASEASFEEVAELHTQVDRYLEKASSRLERCADISDPFLYNVAVDYLNRVAANYNSLAQAHNTQITLSAR
ncbi:hypothetical protein HCU74_13045 [Spongiibacter sp. KMU-166]|uniref:Uncharacterized protein n=1 Tax=Spongiibacter thalassae TaxID=2721624 RepID=A0ABX1GGR5_9GAMM|nr:hypothetical protein [Spongiibacter thalassae]NKI18336.1 hypothetical protein [Spongiibacter thalassae]